MKKANRLPGNKAQRRSARRYVEEDIAFKSEDDYMWLANYMWKSHKKHKADKKKYRIENGDFADLKANTARHLKIIIDKKCTAQESLELICYIFKGYYDKNRVLRKRALGAFRTYKHRNKPKEKKPNRFSIGKKDRAKLEKMLSDSEHEKLLDFLTMVEQQIVNNKT